MSKKKFGIIASVSPKNAEQLVKALEYTGGANSVEVRLDDLVPIVDNKIVTAITSIKMPVIVSMCPIPPSHIWSDGAIQERWMYWSRLPKKLREAISDPAKEIYADWGQELVEFVLAEHRRFLFPWQKIGISWHNFKETPSTEGLQARLEMMRGLKAEAFIKIATLATRDTDIGKIENLLRNNTRNNGSRPLIAFAIGKLGTASRIECLEWGSAGTYGYVPRFNPTAPGQLSVVELYEDPTVRGALQ